MEKSLLRKHYAIKEEILNFKPLQAKFLHVPLCPACRGQIPTMLSEKFAEVGKMLGGWLGKLAAEAVPPQK